MNRSEQVVQQHAATYANCVSKLPLTSSVPTLKEKDYYNKMHCFIYSCKRIRAHMCDVYILAVQ